MKSIQEKVIELNNLLQEILAYKHEHPDAINRHSLSIESLLNAYREGDITFDEAVLLIKNLEPNANLIYVPGDWICPQCHCRVHQRTLYAQSGDVGVNLKIPDNCHNDGMPMMQLTYKQDAEVANQLALDLLKQSHRRLLRLQFRATYWKPQCHQNPSEKEYYYRHQGIIFHYF